MIKPSPSLSKTLKAWAASSSELTPCFSIISMNSLKSTGLAAQSWNHDEFFYKFLDPNILPNIVQGIEIFVPYWAVHSYCTIGVFVHISDHVLQILFWRIKAMSSHNLKILNFKNVLDALNIENNTKIQIPVFLFFSVYCVDCWLSVPSLIRWSYQGRWTVHYTLYLSFYIFFKVKYGILHYLVLL